MSLDLLEKKYLENGYVILRDFFPKKTLSRFRNSILGHIVNQLNKHNLKDFKDPFNNGLIELNKIRMNKNNLDSVQIIYNTVRKLPELFELISDEQLLKVIKRLSGLETINSDLSPYIWETFCRIDPPKDGTFDLKWHQESYFTLPNSNSVQLWAPIINDVSLEETGTISVIKKSHLYGELKHSIVRHNDSYISESIKDERINYVNSDLENFKLNVGDVLLFHENLIHKTLNNKGDKVRYTMIANYSNPCLSNFKFMSENEVIAYHKMRTDNAKDFTKYIDSDELWFGFEATR